tara:strand:+ start:1184 stop:1564 length:381 start_codon:yes stop_codon:yes gene_type:complete
MHCNYIEEYGKTYVGSKWETKHPYLGCHPKKGYTVKDLVRRSPLVAATPPSPALASVRRSRGVPRTAHHPSHTAPPAESLRRALSQQKSVPPLKWTPTDLAKMAERNSPYSVQDIFALFMDRGQLA